MPQQPKAKFRLEDIVTEEVSLVDRAANKRRFLFVKRDNQMATEIKPTDSGDFTTDETKTEDETESTEKASNSKALSELNGIIGKLTQLANKVKSAPPGADMGDQIRDVATSVASTLKTLMAGGGSGDEDKGGGGKPYDKDSDKSDAKKGEGDDKPEEKPDEKPDETEDKPDEKPEGEGEGDSEDDVEKRLSNKERQYHRGVIEGMQRLLADLAPKDKPEADDESEEDVEKAEVPEEIVAQFDEVKSMFDSLQGTIKKQETELQKFRSMPGTPNGTPSEGENEPSVPAGQVVWPRDMNKPEHSKGLDA